MNQGILIVALNNDTPLAARKSNFFVVEQFFIYSGVA
jgi:hypothetical protein